MGNELGQGRTGTEEAEAIAGLQSANLESFGRGNITAAVHRAEFLRGRTGKSSGKRGL